MDSQFLSAVILLTLVADPFGNMPLVNAMLGGVAESRRRLVVVRECLIAYALLLAFMLGRQSLLDPIEWTEDAGIMSKGYFILGLPDGYETRVEDNARSFEAYGRVLRDKAYSAFLVACILMGVTATCGALPTIDKSVGLVPCCQEWDTGSRCRAGRACGPLLETVGDSSFGQIVWRQLDQHTVAQQHTDVVPAHLA